MKAYAQTDCGRRPINEDAYYLPREGEAFCAIADGMGGHNAGEVASSLACEVFSEDLRGIGRIDECAIRQAVLRANQKVYDRSRRIIEECGMGTTFTALAECEGSLWIAHVGDSRAYLIRGGEATRLTVDHTLVEEMVMRGIITEREAKYHPRRNLITRALGTDSELLVDTTRIEIESGDVVFLCTDGLSNYVEKGELLEITNRADLTWQEKLDALVTRALRAGSTDNVTGVYAVFEEAAQ